MTDREREDWALYDQAAKVLIGVPLALQDLLLLGMMLWT